MIQYRHGIQKGDIVAGFFCGGLPILEAMFPDRLDRDKKDRDKKVAILYRITL